MLFLDKVFTVIDAIPDISKLPVCPTLFSDNSDKHDCDECNDNFDCKWCWKEAIVDADTHECIERLRESQDTYAVNANHWANRTKFIDMIGDFVGYLEIDDLPVTPSIFSYSDEYKCELCENRWKLHDSHDPDVCLLCWRKAITEAYENETDENKLNGAGQKAENKELENGD